MIYFVGINHKGELSAFCPTTRSGKKIDEVIAQLVLNDYKKINLYSTDYIPKKWSIKHIIEISKFLGNVQDGKVFVLLGKEVQRRFPYEGIGRAKIIKFRHPSFSGASFVPDLVKILSQL